MQTTLNFMSPSSQEQQSGLLSTDSGLLGIDAGVDAEQQFPELNNEKTDVILIGSRHQHSLFKMEHITLNGHDLPFSESVRDLGVILDNRLNMNDLITSVCKSANYHLRNIAKIRRYLAV